MQYRKDRKGNDISLLGFGCMRFEEVEQENIFKGK